MNTHLIWLHEEALRITHPVFTIAPAGTRVIYIWDDNYLSQMNYSLKRLIFIYETLCELPIDIIFGDTCETIKGLKPSILFAPSTLNPSIISSTKELSAVMHVHVVDDDSFATINSTKDFHRFFKYWGEAKKAPTTGMGK